MFNGYAKSTLRHLVRHRFHTALNILGLAVGLAASLLIFLYVKHERSYDRFHDRADDIYRIVMHQPGNSASGTEWWVVSPHILAETVRRDVPEVMAATRILRQSSAVQVDRRPFVEDNFYIVDPDFFRVFTFPLVSGNPESALSEPFTAVLTETTAAKYFGAENPVGRTIRIGEGRDYRITGVVKDAPKNSHFTFDLLASYASLDILYQNQKMWKTDWFNNPFKTYLRLRPGADPKVVDEKLQPYAFEGFGKETYRFHVQPLTEIHFQGRYNGELEANGDEKYLFIFSAVAAFLLLIACSNFVNLATARSFLRAREVGVRKVVGAGRRQLIGQFLAEALLLSGAALLIAFLLVVGAMPMFRRLVGSGIPLRSLVEPGSLLFAFGSAVGVGLLAGVYPALFLSRILPVNAMKRNPSARTGAPSSLRGTLVVVQFVISAVLITGTLVVRGQLDYMRTKNLGYRRDHVVTMNFFRDPGLARNMEAVKQSLKNNPRIKAVSSSTHLINRIGWSNQADWQGRNPEDKPFFYRLGVDGLFMDFYGLEIVQGRAFASAPGAEGMTSYILNETAVKRMGLKDPIGRPFGYWKIDGTIVGVMRDFHFQPLNTPVAPLGLSLQPPGRLNRISLNIEAADVAGVLDDLRTVWNRYATAYPFQYDFLDDTLDMMYKKEQNLAEGFGGFTLIAVFVAALGLYGLASFSAERRTREIGIRKVMGAGVTRLVALLAWDFAKWIALALLLAVPAAFFAMNAWLRTFAYRISPPLSAFLLSGLFVFLSAALTVGRHMLKAATANPVQSLRQD